LALLDNKEGEVAINDVDSDIKGLGQQLEFGVHVDEPVDQNGSHIFVNLGLALHVGCVRLSLFFHELHILLDVGAVLAHVVDVGHRRLVQLVHARVDVALDALAIHLELSAEADFRKFVARTKTRMVSVEGARDCFAAFLLLEIEGVQRFLKHSLRVDARLARLGVVQAGVSGGVSFGAGEVR